MSGERIQKVLARLGIDSRRAIERMILEGRISVNDQPVRSLPCFVDPLCDRIKVNGKLIRLAQFRKVAYLLSKPRGVICSARQYDQRRPIVSDLVPAISKPVYIVGGLDADTTGLVVVTNDGQLADRLTHVRYAMERIYVVEVDAPIPCGTIEALKKGVVMDDRRSTAAHLVKVLRKSKSGCLLEIHLVESHPRQLPRMLTRLKCKARKIKRVGLGPLSDTGLKVGSYRRLTEREYAKVLEATRPVKSRPAGLRSGADRVVKPRRR